MNYEYHYDKLIFRAKLRELYFPLSCYTEKHHIVPKCINPAISDLRKNPQNCAILTPEEHYLAHLLLVKMLRYKNHKFHYKLIMAARNMTFSSKDCHRVNNKLYGWLKREWSKINSSSQKGRTPWNKGKTGVQVAWNKGQETKESTRIKISKSRTGQSLSHQSLEKMVTTRKKNREQPGFIDPIKGRPSKLKGTKRKMPPWNKGKSAPHKGVPHSKETKAMMSRNTKMRHLKIKFCKTASEIF